MDNEILDIPLKIIAESRLLLRPVVRESVEYLELRDSIAECGVLNSICVRPLPPTPPSPCRYEVVDGMWRFAAARDVRLTTIPCVVKHGLTDEDVLSLQIQANAIRPETKLSDYARQLKAVMASHPDVPMSGIAHLFHKSPQWVSEVLGLLRLDRQTQLDVDRGEIALQNAYMLAKIPFAHRDRFLEKAKTMPVRTFRPLAAEFIKQYREAVRQGKLDILFVQQFKPVAYLRSVRKIQDELDGRRQGPIALTKADCKTPLEAFYMGLRWVLHLDDESVEEQRRRAIARQRQSEGSEAV